MGVLFAGGGDLEWVRVWLSREARRHRYIVAGRVALVAARSSCMPRTFREAWTTDLYSKTAVSNVQTTFD